VLVAVDTVSGAAKLKRAEDGKPIKCKITDPQLKSPMNVYTHALDTARPVELRGKPVFKEDGISNFYVSDAKALG